MIKEYIKNVITCYDCISWKFILITGSILKPVTRYIDSNMSTYKYISILSTLLQIIFLALVMCIIFLSLTWSFFFKVYNFKIRISTEFVDDVSVLVKISPDLIGLLIRIKCINKNKVLKVIKDKETNFLYDIYYNS